MDEELNLDEHAKHPFWAGKLAQMVEEINIFMGQKMMSPPNVLLEEEELAKVFVVVRGIEET